MSEVKARSGPRSSGHRLRIDTKHCWIPGADVLWRGWYHPFTE